MLAATRKGEKTSYHLFCCNFLLCEVFRPDTRSPYANVYNTLVSHKKVITNILSTYDVIMLVRPHIR